MSAVRTDPAERFWPKVDKGGPDGCWLWTASFNPYGYGQFYTGSRLGKAHRFAYELVVGPIPDGLELDHLCRNRGCVNPAHLEPVTHVENQRRMRKSHCFRGHAYDEANTLKLRDGKRQCRSCNRERMSRLRQEESA